MTIYKYPVPSEDNFTIKLPYDAVILTVQTQGKEPFIWVAVEPEEEKETRIFRIITTGYNFDNLNGLSYIGTFQIYNGSFVGHLFEVKEI